MNKVLRFVKTHRTLSIVVSCVITLIIFVWAGFGREEKYIDTIHTEYSVHVDAKFRQSYQVWVPGTTTKIGNTTTTTPGHHETRYKHWDVQVSDSWNVKSIDGELVDFSCPKDALQGKFRCKTPPYAKIDHGRYFQGFGVDERFDVTVFFSDGTYCSEPERNLKSLLDKIGSFVLSKTWYGIEYGVVL